MLVPVHKFGHRASVAWGLALAPVVVLRHHLNRFSSVPIVHVVTLSQTVETPTPNSPGGGGGV